jgi:hypothetical protein
MPAIVLCGACGKHDSTKGGPNCSNCGDGLPASAGMPGPAPAAEEMASLGSGGDSAIIDDRVATEVQEEKILKGRKKGLQSSLVAARAAHGARVADDIPGFFEKPTATILGTHYYGVPEDITLSDRAYVRYQGMRQGPYMAVNGADCTNEKARSSRTVFMIGFRVKKETVRGSVSELQLPCLVVVNGNGAVEEGPISKYLQLARVPVIVQKNQALCQQTGNEWLQEKSISRQTAAPDVQPHAWSASYTRTDTYRCYMRSLSLVRARAARILQRPRARRMQLNNQRPRNGVEACTMTGQRLPALMCQYPWTWIVKAFSPTGTRDWLRCVS